jgi:glucose/arabinose dehydrogenase
VTQLLRIPGEGVPDNYRRLSNPPITGINAFVHPPHRNPAWLRAAVLVALVGLISPDVAAQPFAVQGPGVNANDFRVTTFASGLDFPLGMAELPDGSLLVTVSQGANYFSAPGRLVRLTDTNQDGIADGPTSVLYSNLVGSLTAVRVAGSLVLVTGQARPITILRAGTLPSDPLTLVGQITINYPTARSHPHSALGLRRTPGYTNRYDLLFQLGAEYNFTVTTNTLVLTNSNIPGAQGVLTGDAVHMLTLIDNGTTVIATNLLQIASGLRNAAGFAFHPATGHLYLQDNGIDGLINGNEPLSADELNFIARTNLGGAVEFFGFPANYTLYRTNTFVGGDGIPPLISFQPIPDPFTGRESEGVNDLIFAPPGFPNGLNTGIFLGFHGRFSSAGAANEENPVVFADPATGSYFHFIRGQQPGLGHLDGLLATRDSLFAADLVSTGNLSSGAGAGLIYQIKSLVTPTPPTVTARRVGTEIELQWDRGALQSADESSGDWSAELDAFSPLLITPAGQRKFYRTRY